MKNERGFITLDFIFALTLAFGFSIVFFAMSITLASVEVGQYITFAMARAYYGAHENEQMQRDLAQAKYDELVNTSIFKRLFNQGWVSISNGRVGDFNDTYREFDRVDNEIFVGAQVDFKARVLNIRLPIIGSTSDESTTGSATLNAYLMREVSTQECRDFNQQRYQKIRQLDSKYGELSEVQETLITDNGC